MFFFILKNKPGMIIIGRQPIYDTEWRNGKEPFKISTDTAVGLMERGWDLWVSVGSTYKKYSSPYPNSFIGGVVLPTH